MNAANRRTALAALGAARPTVARLDASRNPEDTAADILDAWAAVETALRSLMGGSSLTGTALIRELRQRQLLSLDQANELVAFQAARDRVQRTEYRPTAADVAAARDGFRRLEEGIAKSDPDAPAAPLPASPLPGPAPASIDTVTTVGAPPARRRMLIGVVAVILVAALGAAAYAYLRTDSGSAATQRGVAYYRQGSREAARSEFYKAIQEDSNQAVAHVFLGRLYREDARYDSARLHLEKAVRVDPSSASAEREMGSLLYAEGNYELAVNFYRRALETDQYDHTAQGYLGCALAKLGRADVAQRFLSRAGPGPWSACVVPAGTLPPAGAPARGP